MQKHPETSQYAAPRRRSKDGREEAVGCRRNSPQNEVLVVGNGEMAESMRAAWGHDLIGVLGETEERSTGF